jgi:FAD binding domain
LLMPETKPEESTRLKSPQGDIGGHVLAVHPQFRFGVSDHAKYSPRRRSFQSTPSRRSSQPAPGRSQTMTTKLITANMEENLTLPKLTNTKGVAASQDRIEGFQAEFRGEVIQPGDSGYETARKIWNASIDKHPGIIARCSGVADVVAAVNFARENELLIAVRGGGHNVSGKALCDDGIVIDLSGMKGIYVDAKNRTARVQGGAMLGDVDRETHVFGLAVPAGVVSKTGIAGLTLGGRCRLASQEIRSDL